MVKSPPLHTVTEPEIVALIIILIQVTGYLGKYNMETRKKRTIIIATVVLALGIIVAIVFSIIEQSKYSATVEIAVTPLKATLTLNGTEYKNGTHRLLPGAYEVSLTAEDFEPYTATIEAQANTTTYLYRYLTGPDGDISYYSYHEEDMWVYMTVVNYEMAQRAKAYADKDAIFKITPYYDVDKNHFTIQASITDEENIEITINLNTCTDLLKDEYSKEALEYLKSHNIATEKYGIKYVGLCD